MNKVSRIFFTENELTIINLLRKNPSLSKARLAELGGMSWATAVKMTARLMKKGIIAAAGLGIEKGKPGKKELLYGLAPNALYVVGIDVEYTQTTLVLMNLAGEIVMEDEAETPQNPTVPALRTFLAEQVEKFLLRIDREKTPIAGIGIGLPGIVIPAWLKPDAAENRKHLEDFLSASSGLRVTIEINARASTNYLKWDNPFFPGEDFVFVSIRTGVGMGIIFHGELLIGHQFIGGELGHIKIARNSTPCRCGGEGCLETLINQAALYRKYSEKVLGRKECGNPGRQEIVTGLPELFTRAAEGNKPAKAIIQGAAEALGKALSYSLMTMYIPNVIIGGCFGKDGGVLLEPLERELKRNLLRSMNVNLRYLPIERVPFAQSDALLALNAYFNP